MDESNVSKLIQQCKASDVDVKIDSMTRLQAEFENGATIPDADAVIQTFKACLRVSHQHLQAATLAALPPLLPLLLSNVHTRPAALSASASTSSAGSSSIDSFTLRQALIAFLPTGGIIDRLGDARERSREKARESLAILGGLAFRAGGGSALAASKSGKSQETAMQMLERLLKEIGLASKAWRVREQSILTLVDIRRAHHLFPIRPYLPMLVGALEDSDSTVRETAKTSVVVLFTGPGASDAARADLKRELTRKGVRKTIVDAVLTRVLGSDNASTAIGESTEAPDVPQPQMVAKKEYIPPSLALQAQKSAGGSDFPAPGPSTFPRTVSHANVKESSRPSSRTAVASPTLSGGDTTANVQAVYVASSKDLGTEFAEMLKSFEGKETEHNWAPRDRAVTRVRGMLKGDVHVRYAETFISHLKSFIDASLKTLASLRTIVATNTCSFYNELAVALGPTLDPYVDTLLSNLLRMAGFTKKIMAQTSQATVDIIIKNTSLQPRVIIPLFWTGLQDKTTQARSFVIEHVKTYLDAHGSRVKTAVEASGVLDTVENCVKKSLTDANAGVRQNARAAFWSFEGLWKERGRIILEAQDGTSRKQLEKACPNQQDLPAVQPTTPQAKKSSLAAAIAASRAKAKTIATAPPTLRHQATSAARTVSSPKRSLSPQSTGNVSGRITPTSPSVSLRPKGSIYPSRIRTASGTIGTMSHSRTSSGESTKSVPYPGHRVVPMPFSSPPRGSVLRQAIQTALPSSPSPELTTDTLPTPVSLRSSEREEEQQTASFARHSLYLPDFDDTDPAKSDLLTAIAIPLPDDSDSDMNESVSFSSPYEKYPPGPQSKSRTRSQSPASNGHQPGFDRSSGTGSPHASVPQPVVEDVLRARAEQAQSAAERLLELVEPEDRATQPLASLLLNDRPTSPTTKIPMPSRKAQMRTPSTPVNKTATVRKQAAAFQDSPVQRTAPSLMTDMLRTTRVDGAWWRKRMALFNQRNPLLALSVVDAATELQGYITALDQGTADVSILKKLATFCVAHPSVDAISPLSSSLSMPASPSPFITSAGLLPSLKPELWTENRSFTRLFNSLQKFLTPDKGEELLQYGLIVLWEMLEYLTLPMEGHEGEVFTICLTVRYSDKQQVFEATNTLRDAVTSRIEAVYGLTTLHASLVSFRASAVPPSYSEETKASSYAFGLIALAKFALRLPAEVLEEELPRLKHTLVSALTDTTSLVVREAAAAAIIAAQVVLRDDAHLFALLDGLADDKKNLLTYLFDKHGVRGMAGSGGVDRLEREMRRLDGRTGTPIRTAPVRSSA
ncbi:clasp N terminal-domain-containing protein [Russula earlei]|uniref:Clasp N terminal-domain-containing protein n=1 Tax=Russula earlei TaxID=71964 RepID=A0ACC0UFN1_9AGAM|nr:clasp N terminal-domain-containing protein [Russula earlei]